MVRVTREQRERQERELLAPSATLSASSRGRERPELDDELRTVFERDRDRILHAKAFRRLKHKTQVFLDPDGDHYVTRLTHTVQVAQVGRAIARALGLNETLTEAICLGHDIGHSPFGHAGEDALSPYVEDGPHGRWLHSVQSVRVVRRLEPLNLTAEVRDGIRAHSWRIDPPPESPEGWVCRYADRIAYLAHDVLDAVRAGVITAADVPSRYREVFGDPGRDWIDAMIRAVVDASVEAGQVTMAPEPLAVMSELRDWMFERIYLRPEAEAHAQRAVTVIRDLVGWFVEHPDQVPEACRLEDADPAQAAVDHVAGMSDRFAIRLHGSTAQRSRPSDERLRFAELY